ncbi:putative prp18 domain-containing protein [Diaporthe ampelina]|uniref:Pre-mRNA-splicing factor 18 n=1 Tax=Diaporthe ampelina TaxID=1214573 RepID=A0A0G2FZU4_9PEZI|nr:putative prp18 domain-containing protein [Diaporthe ampelina]
MDFAALMSQELAKKKGPSPSDPKAAADASKYTRKADAEAAREEAYRAEQKRLAEEKEAKASAKRKREEDAAEEAKAREEKRRKLAEESRRRREEKEAEEERARRKRLGLPELKRDGSTPASGGGDDDAQDEASGLTDEELTAKLRALGEPAALFGEARAARVKRYRRLTTSVTQGPIPTTLQLVEEKDMKVPDEVPAADDREARRWLYRQLASYFTMVLREWELALARERAQAGGELETSAARQAYSTMVQCKQTMTPLFRRFEKADLDESVLKPVVEIVRAAQERRYVDANDGYLRLSIGKAAWPIGVTMVGIHERSAREKLHNGERGHVMGDEVTRKYLQSIKRCLTFAQVRWPPEDVRQLMG